MTDSLVTYVSAPRCGRCSRLHLATLPCWGSTYRQRLVAATLSTKGNLCWLCGEHGADTVDHRVPRSYGGDDSPENLMPAHLSCNSERGNAPPPGLAAQVVVITGEPTRARAWLDSRAQPGDLVVDLDALVAAVVADPEHAPPERLALAHVLARRARAAALAAAYRMFAGPTVYVTDPAPNSEARRVYLAHAATFHDAGGDASGSWLPPGHAPPLVGREPPGIEGSLAPPDLVPSGASRPWLSDARTPPPGATTPGTPGQALTAAPSPLRKDDPA